MTPYKRKEVIGNATLYLGDCLEILPTLGPVDTVITSPPYAEQRDYGPDRGWLDNMLGLRLLGDECQILVNLGLIYRDGECVTYWDDLRAMLAKDGWRLFGWYVWDQGDGLPGDWNGRLAPSHEFVFHFNKKARPLMKWTRTKTSNRKITGTGLRGKNNVTKGKFSHQGEFVQDTKVADSVIRVTREMRRDVDHPARFPVSFAENLVASFSNPEHTVLDPFMGSGTTGISCHNLGRKFIGIEIEPKYFDIACERIENAQRQERLFA